MHGGARCRGGLAPAWRRRRARTIGGIDAIVLDSAADVVVTIGGEPKLRIETDHNLLEVITTKVEGKTLTIATTENYSTRLGVKIERHLPAATLAGFERSGRHHDQRGGG